MRGEEKMIKITYVWILLGIEWEPLVADTKRESEFREIESHGCLTWWLSCLFAFCCSSSLDALDADSEGEGHSEQLHSCYTPACQSSSRAGITSGDELDSFETNTEPDFNISRTESFSLSSNLQLKVFLLLFIWFIKSLESMLSKSVHLWKTNYVYGNTCECFVNWRPMNFMSLSFYTLTF